jgi:GNAT superfamily N-acetyltransferase
VNQGLAFRDAVPGDETVVAGFVRALAEFEKLAHECVATPADFGIALFGTPARCHALIAEQDGATIGFALWHYCFSTFTGRHGLYVEDVYVDPAQRGQGVGRAIFRDLARRAVAEGCGYMKWSVLDWNVRAVDFYTSLGAISLDEWTTRRLDGGALAALAA